MPVQSVFSKNKSSMYMRRRESDGKIVDRCIEYVVIEFELSLSPIRERDG